jgi:hypothetical protein
MECKASPALKPGKVRPAQPASETPKLSLAPRAQDQNFQLPDQNFLLQDQNFQLQD